MNKVEEFQQQIGALQALRKAAIQEAELMLNNVREEEKRLEALVAELKGEPLGGDGKPHKTRFRDPSLPCTVCSFVTVPNHDGRTHRFQKVKRPLNGKELAQRKMTKLP